MKKEPEEESPMERTYKKIEIVGISETRALAKPLKMPWRRPVSHYAM
jgi:hypothetical protein